MLAPGSIGESGTGGYGQDCWLVAGLNVECVGLLYSCCDVATGLLRLVVACGLGGVFTLVWQPYFDACVLPMILPRFYL